MESQAGENCIEGGRRAEYGSNDLAKRAQHNLDREHDWPQHGVLRHRVSELAIHPGGTGEEDGASPAVYLSVGASETAAARQGSDPGGAKVMERRGAQDVVALAVEAGESPGAYGPLEELR
ncbi:uncharacterized protein DNG_07406 [Cephalotrichum gorgonifer]|uniref:Uncharacterized protein n=1 Tax=Cephalotrichum gorgonifer TaxID=2041049 RepID=A0AAE8N1K2_9PEZI|nr:uncharacterized protein DNG_07406 [Cephalotrichum gorgonifer]